MDTLTFVPSTATQAVVEPRVLRAQFGDGYMQEMGDGLNSVLRKWELNYQPIHATSGTSPTLKDLNDFFTLQAGYKKFFWTQPAPFNVEGLKQFVCSRWSFTYDRGLITGLRATLEQRPET